MVYSNGDKHEPCVTPASICLVVDKLFEILTAKERPFRNEESNLVKVIGMPDWCKLWRNPFCYTLLKAFSISKNSDAVCSFSFLLTAKSFSILTS